ncbi:MAG: Segregation and condensation protein A [Candidatus Nomurabacteria bacterium GW2011_GWA2_43_15]|uniref:Segregation and condensation protein A n=3 Tax=Candidatus Nomuraibacteriota TaxID=1752729 RepID=A0A0G0QRW5_9BACT|nr:MAG: Segregation and condensation protein A [Candidatus Nomurabacteria bacterium GW2011_GWF2_40_12]KKT00366.1 MAG: Segregation and condensation protein A [Candidatus Nomurabacteria bacterium GW2011_GWA2_43_15]KKT19078.1 MAG: Segregation and condensation protein A [Candidatus Nomurabacteria bacterium GW2011_GWB1_43_7]
METEAFKIKTTGFEGPLGLLLDLVEKRKLFINDVSLAQVTDDYLQYINKLGGLSPAEVSSFILVASTLLLIKSKSLLPNLDLTEEEKGDIRDLEERLRLYKIFTKLSAKVKNNFGRKMIFSPLERKNEVVVFLPDEQITKESMMTFAQNALGAMPKNVFLPKVEVRTVVSIEEMIDRLTDRIKNSLKMSFRDWSGRPATREEKVTAIVGFLAMLELVRQGIIKAKQEHHSADIIIEKTETIEIYE